MFSSVCVDWPLLNTMCIERIKFGLIGQNGVLLVVYRERDRPPCC